MRKPGKRGWILLGVVLALILLALALMLRPSAPPPGLAPTQTPTPVATPAPTTEPTPTIQPTPAPTATPAPLKAIGFELPVAGSSGYASVAMKLRISPAPGAASTASLSAGAPFRVLQESGGWFRVQTEGAEGWVESRYCLINLPDVIPSIVYDATNTYASIIRASGAALPGITGHGLYPGKQKNDRLGARQFIMPVLYPMAKKIYKAQRAALSNSETLVIYEAYRPYDVQMKVVRALEKLAAENETVRKGITTSPWSLSWFASTRLSNHQRGGAIDVSLAKVNATVQAVSGRYGYTVVTESNRYKMPTAMHELSAAAAAFAVPVSARSRTAWRKAEPSRAMNAAALRLQRYCTDAGLTPLASEWWHFNDLETLENSGANPSSGRYTLSTCMSAPPETK